MPPFYSRAFAQSHEARGIRYRRRMQDARSGLSWQSAPEPCESASAGVGELHTRRRVRAKPLIADMTIAELVRRLPAVHASSPVFGSTGQCVRFRSVAGYRGPAEVVHG